ncbi:MAG TPA: hypothetical protein VJA94_04010 [Candidatus Angelobacter sp.]
MTWWFIARVVITIVLALLAFGLICTGVVGLLAGNLVLPLIQIALGVWLAIVSSKTAHAKSGKISLPEPGKLP